MKSLTRLALLLVGLGALVLIGVTLLIPTSGGAGGGWEFIPFIIIAGLAFLVGLTLLTVQAGRSWWGGEDVGTSRRRRMAALVGAVVFAVLGAAFLRDGPLPLALSVGALAIASLVLALLPRRANDPEATDADLA